MSASHKDLEFLEDAYKNNIHFKTIILDRIKDEKILLQIELISALELLIRPILYDMLSDLTHDLSIIE